MAATDDRTDSTQEKLAELERLREEAAHQGSERAVERQRSQGKLLAGERLERAFDRIGQRQGDEQTGHGGLEKNRLSIEPLGGLAKPEGLPYLRCGQPDRGDRSQSEPGTRPPH